MYISHTRPLHLIGLCFGQRPCLKPSPARISPDPLVRALPSKNRHQREPLATRQVPAPIQSILREHLLEARLGYGLKLHQGPALLVDFTIYAQSIHLTQLMCMNKVFVIKQKQMLWEANPVCNHSPLYIRCLVSLVPELGSAISQ